MKDTESDKIMQKEMSRQKQLALRHLRHAAYAIKEMGSIALDDRWSVEYSGKISILLFDTERVYRNISDIPSHPPKNEEEVQ